MFVNTFNINIGSFPDRLHMMGMTFLKCEFYAYVNP